MDATALIRVRCRAVEKERELIGEAPVRIAVQDRPYATLLATPGEAEALAAGFCLSEGMIAAPDDLESVRADDGGRLVRVVLSAGRLAALDRQAARPRHPSDAPDIEVADVPPLADGPVFDAAAVRGCIEGLDALQPLRRRTRAAHAAALYDECFTLLSVAEDVGRHNALDKAVGKLLLGGGFHRIRLLVLSSRISFEMVQKAARARVRVVAAVSRPTALAVSTAGRLRMTLVTPDGSAGLCVYCGGKRLDGFTEDGKTDVDSPAGH